MNGLSTAAALAAATAAAVCVAPILVVAATAPGQSTQAFVHACTEVRGARAAILPDPPATPPSPDEVLLRIATTATTLGVGRQGATVAAAISLRATGLTQAANPEVPDSQRYAHSTQSADGVGALGLPPGWGSPAELMTPQVATALVIDRMLNVFPDWRDTDPAEMAALIRGGTAQDYRSATAAAQDRLAALPALPPAATPATGTAAAPPTAVPAAPPPALTLEQARAAGRDTPELADCAAALTTAIPVAATRPSPHGPQLAAAADRAVGSTPRLAQAPVFVADVAATVGVWLPDTLAGQFALGATVTGDPAPGDLVFVDISADQGPHLVGIAVGPDTMVTVFPGHPTPEWARIGSARVVRRIE
jgi:cell wall-associated NlpC family hydrolase